MIWIKSTVLDAMALEASRSAPKETGGIVLGYRLSANEAVILACVGPGPNAIHESDRFAPDYDFQEREIVRHFAESSGIMDYLGDWHSHPGTQNAYLSDMDLKTLGSIACCKTCRLQYPLMLVLTSIPQWTASIFQGRVKKSFFRKKLLAEHVELRIFG